MSVTVWLTAASDADVADLLAHPEHYSRFILGGDLIFESNEERASWFREGVPPRSLQHAKPPAKCEMDKAWAAIHHLLSKSSNDVRLHFVERGGRPILEPKKKKKEPALEIARAFSSDEVRALSDALASINGKNLAEHYDPSELSAERVYPLGEDWKTSDLEYITHWFEVTKTFVQQVANNRLGMLVSST